MQMIKIVAGIMFLAAFGVFAVHLENQKRWQSVMHPHWEEVGAGELGDMVKLCYGPNCTEPMPVCCLSIEFDDGDEHVSIGGGWKKCEGDQCR